MIEQKNANKKRGGGGGESQYVNFSALLATVVDTGLPV